MEIGETLDTPNNNLKVNSQYCNQSITCLIPCIFQGHSRNGNRKHYQNSPHRNAYHDGGRHRSSHGHRNNYGHYKRNVDDDEQNGVVYTPEGGIDWSKSKVSKVADTSNSEEKQNYRDSSPNQYQRNQRHSFDDEEDDYDEQYSDSRYHEKNRYNKYDTYDDDEYEDDYYEDDYYSNSGRSGRKNSNYYDDDYSGDDDDSINYQNNRGHNNKQAYSNGRNAYTSASTDSLPFSNGIRLAGTLPDDGYHRGEGTFYDLETHIGTCGKQNKNTEYVVALNAEEMGEASSKNENCNKEVEITGPSGKTVKATIVDSCKTCEKGGLDLSPAGKFRII